tara:strand:+ start:4731 stop:10220 length:5490 start_codon:yes stop_codon:yes gene_type:complete
MGIALPQLAPASEDRVSGAQVIDGSLKFDGATSGGVHGFGHLRRTSSGASGGGTFTISWWAKRGSMRGDWQYMIAGDNGSLWGVGFVGTSGDYDSLTLFNGSHQYSAARFRDNSGWYHIVLSVDADDGPRLWVNGELQSNANTNASWNLNNTMYIGKWVDSGTAHNYDGYLAQYTCIDGLELGPSYFAYNDPLTGAWRPKKFVAEGTTVNDGTVWSDSSSDPNNVKASGAAGQLFNGNLSAGGVVLNKTTTSSNNWYEALTGVSIPCNNSVAFYSANGASTATMRINGDDNLKVEAQTSTNGWWALNFEGIITKIELAYLDGSGSSNTYYGIQIDGVTLIDSTTQNLAFGNAGFYLPLDGNTPVGQDLSGNGNDWKPQGFGGSVELDNHTITGARPILNTTQGGAIAAPGVFGSKESKNYTVTTANGGVYQFDLTSGDNPSLSFIRGATYRFDYSSHTGHPLLFSSTNPDSSTTAYTTGTNIASNVISFTVPHDAPDTLYYYCSAHPTNMNGTISVTTDETKADKYAANCVLALPLVGNNTDVCDQINCTTTAKVLAPQGNATNSKRQSNWYGESFKFDGSGDYLGATSHADFAMGTGDFTLECWVYKESSGAFMNFLATRGGPGTTAGFTWGSQSSGNGYDIEFYTNGLQLNGGNQWITDKRWHHVAVTRSGTTLRSYVNGILNSTATNSQNLTNTSLAIGITNDASQGPLDGYLQDIRIYKGVAKYTGGTIDNQVFVIPATEPNIMPDSPSGAAVKSQLTEITDGAVAFNGDTYLTVSDSADFTMGTDDFTIEMTIMPDDSNHQKLLLAHTSGGDYGPFNLYTDSGELRLYSSSNGSGWISGLGPLVIGKPSVNKWSHVAVTRSGNTFRVFLDGKLTGSATSSASLMDPTGKLQIAARNGASKWSGHVSNVRIIKGTALYTTSFAPPTKKLTNVTNTKLLCCQSNTRPGDATVAPLISGVNNGTQWSGSLTTGSKFRSGFPAADAFNGESKSSTNDCAAVDIIQYGFVEFTFGGGVPFTTLQMQCDDNNSGLVYVNGVDITSQLPTGSLTNTTITGVSSPLTSLKMIKTTSDTSSVYLGSVTVDGTMLVDPVGPGGDEAPVATKFNPLNTDITTVRRASGSQVTLNPKDFRSFSNGPSYNLQNGNLTVYMVGGNANASKDRGLVASTIDIPDDGKWYCEIHTEYMQNDDIALGIASDIVEGYYETGGNVKRGAYLLRQNGIFYYPYGQLGSGISRVYNSGDMIGLAVDLASDTKTITFYKNGFELYSHVIDRLEGPFKVVAGTDAGSSVGTYRLNFNFGQKPFKSPPPEGFLPLTIAAERPDTVITHPDEYFEATTYRGTGATKNVNVGHKPDLIWIKDRTDTNNHDNNLITSIIGAPNILMSNSNVSEITNSTDGLTAITDTGFTLGANTAGTQSYELNKNNNNYIAWTWKAGGSSNTFNVDGVGYANASDVNMTAGALNSVAYNTSNWVSKTTVSNLYGSHSINSIFNGQYGHIHGTQGNTLTLSWVPGTIKGRVRLLLRNAGSPGNHQYKVHGGTTQSISNVSSSRGWFDLGDVDLTHYYAPHPSSGNAAMIEAIELDGKMLIDSSQTPQDMPTMVPTGCSVGTKQGFSIIKHTGTGNTGSLPHGLTKTPEFIITKVYSGGTGNWNVYFNFIDGSNDYLYLNSTQSKGDSSLHPALPTVFYFGYTSNSYIHYLWHSVPGLQKFGTYKGNSNANGPFIECGFRPAAVLLKKINNTDTNSGWHWYDNKRNTSNPANNFVLASHPYYENRAANNTATVSSYTVDFLSNGFRLSHSSNNLNTAGSDYIYAAWAEAPTDNLYGAMSSAR